MTTMTGPLGVSVGELSFRNPIILPSGTAGYGDELAGFRRRALVAESRVRELENVEAKPGIRQQRELGERLNQLEHENAILRGRLESATARTKAMLDRVRFIRQQAQRAER